MHSPWSPGFGLGSAEGRALRSHQVVSQVVSRALQGPRIIATGSMGGSKEEVEGAKEGQQEQEGQQASPGPSSKSHASAQGRKPAKALPASHGSKEQNVKVGKNMGHVHQAACMEPQGAAHGKSVTEKVHATTPKTLFLLAQVMLAVAVGVAALSWALYSSGDLLLELPGLLNSLASDSLARESSKSTPKTAASGPNSASSSSSSSGGGAGAAVECSDQDTVNYQRLAQLLRRNGAKLNVELGVFKGVRGLAASRDIKKVGTATWHAAKAAVQLACGCMLVCCWRVQGMQGAGVHGAGADASLPLLSVLHPQPAGHACAVSAPQHVYLHRFLFSQVGGNSHRDMGRGRLSFKAYMRSA